MKSNEVTTKQEKAVRRAPVSLQGMFDAVLAYLSLAVLAGLAFKGVEALVDSKPAVSTAIGVVVVLLLVKTALKK